MAYYNVEEQETNINYESESNLYTIYSTVPKHVRKLLKHTEGNEFHTLLQCDLDDKGICIAICLKVEKLPKFSTFSPKRKVVAE